MKTKVVTVLAVVVLAIVGGTAAFWPTDDSPVLHFWPFRDSPFLRLPGIVEIQEVRLGSKVGGRVEFVLIQEGEVVYKNQRLVVLEAPELKNQKEQLQARLHAAEADWQRVVNGARYEEKNAALAASEAAQARYERVKSGPREEEKQQASSDLASAEADYEQAQKDWIRILQLHRQQAASRSDYELALAARDRTKGRMDSARAHVMLLRGSRKEDIDEAKADWDRSRALHEQLVNGSRWEEIAIAKAKVEELRSSLEAVEISLGETTITVPAHLGKAVIEVLSVRPGDLVAANQPVMRVLRAEDLWVKVFVPETEYGLVTMNKKVEVTTDSHPGKVLQGIVVQRSNISEFTPRNVQSVDERHHQVFGVKIRVEDPQGILNAGMAAEVAIPRR